MASHAQAAASGAATSSPSIEIQEKKQSRSTGLRVFDAFLYPFFTNFVVFGISVVATYLTSRGGMKNDEGELIYGKTGEFFQKRGDWLIQKFKNLGMNESSAEMAKIVFFSFADGSLIAPFVKLFEGRREKIGRWIDDRLGTTPDDPNVYAAEPKQSWLSVLGGRLATVSIVVPTAVVLDRTGLNDVLFRNPGTKLGEWIEKRPSIAKFFGKTDIPELSKIGFFEFFYTSVCTAGLYFSSRFFARLGEKQETAPLPPSPATPNNLPVSDHLITGTSTTAYLETPLNQQAAAEASRPHKALAIPAISNEENHAKNIANQRG